ncbi:MAG: molybdenum cofactor carrier [Planctomycetes bacterium]|nr:molybdenum cofactor carrier [Planctomycetota bacterium]
MRYGFIGTEHVLLGLLAAGGEAARLLAGLGTDLGRARAAVVEWTGPTAGFAVERIVSGGPTGVDRAALDVALEYGIPHGGWCPRGRLAEDGRVPANYTMRETDSANFAVRTERNVVDSDATLVFTVGEPSGGTRLTIELCGKHDKPHFVADLRRPPHLVIGDVNRWLVAQSPPTLNVAGPRESGAPGVHAHARMVLGQAMFLARR